MTLDDVLQTKTAVFHGRIATHDEAEALRAITIPAVPVWYIRMLLRYPIIDCRLSLSEDEDLSELGVDLKWMSVATVLEELHKFYPGISAGVCGYLPFGICLSGSGDPYFLDFNKPEDAPVVRVPHTAVDTNDRLIESAVEVVTPTLAQFIANAMP